MVDYKGKQLRQTAPKTGGKNNSPVDGFYIDESGTETQGREYFIKQPEDKKELFTELFAGLLLKEFMARNLIDPAYNASLICADLIQFEDGSYALIQPKVSFTELYDLIGTGDGKDRRPILEMFRGRSRYPALMKQGQYYGLSTALMFSLLIGDHSVHSGNVVVLNPSSQETALIKQFARIDWGAAFRYFFHPDNNKDDIRHFYQYQGWINFKWFTQGYFENYKDIKGLFNSVAEKAKALMETMHSRVNMEEVVKAALSQIPADLLDQETQTTLAAYMCLPEFANVHFGEEGDYQAVSEAFSSILDLRLNKISAMKEANSLQTEPDYSEAYQSVILNRSLVTIDSEMIFHEQLEQLLEQVNQNLVPDFTQINLEALGQQYNQYVQLLAHQSDLINLWTQDGSKVNLFTQYWNRKAHAISGAAFIPQYRDSEILRRLYTIDPITLETTAFETYETEAKAYHQALSNDNSAWSQITSMLNVSLDLIKQMNQLKITQSSSDTDLNNPFVIGQLRDQLRTSLKTLTQTNEHIFTLLGESTMKVGASSESAFFYPISNKELKELSGEQLLTICFEELKTGTPSPLVIRIIADRDLWPRIISEYKEATFPEQQDKIDNLCQWRTAYCNYWNQTIEFIAAPTMEQKVASFKELETTFNAMPPFLNTYELIQNNFGQAKEQLVFWVLSERNYRAREHNFLTNKQLSDAYYPALHAAFLQLPVELRNQYQNQLDSYAKEANYLHKVASFYQKTDLVEAQSIFSELERDYSLFTIEQQAELEKLRAHIDAWQIDQQYLEQEQRYLTADSALRKIEVYAELAAAYEQLPDSLKASRGNLFNTYENEVHFLQQLNLYQEQLTIETRTNAFMPLVNDFELLSSDEKKAPYRPAFQSCVQEHETYRVLLANQTIEGTYLCANVANTLARLNSGTEEATRLQEATLIDARLWNAVSNCTKENLSQEITRDLLALQKFYLERVSPENDAIFGAEYNRSLERFYEQALQIRLSNTPIRDQATTIMALAHQEFHPRHKTERLLADALMLVSILFAGVGLIIMAGRVYFNKTVFFSQAVTERETNLTQSWMVNVDEAAPDESCLFTIPVAAAATA